MGLIDIDSLETIYINKEVLQNFEEIIHSELLIEKPNELEYIFLQSKLGPLMILEIAFDPQIQIKKHFETKSDLFGFLKIRKLLKFSKENKEFHQFHVSYEENKYFLWPSYITSSFIFLNYINRNIEFEIPFRKQNKVYKFESYYSKLINLGKICSY